MSCVASKRTVMSKRKESWLPQLSAAESASARTAIANLTAREWRMINLLEKAT